MTKNWKKTTAEKKMQFFFWSKNAIYLSLSLHKVHPSDRRSLQFLKEAIQHFKIWTLKFFFYFWGSFLPSCGSGSTDPIESGSDPDPQPCYKVFTKLYRLKNHQLIHLGTALCGSISNLASHEKEWDVASLVSTSGCQCMKLCCSRGFDFWHKGI